jgi:hypothetical protein
MIHLKEDIIRYLIVHFGPTEFDELTPNNGAVPGYSVTSAILKLTLPPSLAPILRCRRRIDLTRWRSPVINEAPVAPSSQDADH